MSDHPIPLDPVLTDLAGDLLLRIAAVSHGASDVLYAAAAASSRGLAPLRNSIELTRLSRSLPYIASGPPCGGTTRLLPLGWSWCIEPLAPWRRLATASCHPMSLVSPPLALSPTDVYSALSRLDLCSPSSRRPSSRRPSSLRPSSLRPLSLRPSSLHPSFLLSLVPSSHAHINNSDLSQFMRPYQSQRI